MPLPWIATLLLGLALNTLAYLILGKPKTAQPESTTDLKEPTSESGRPIAMVMGSIRVRDPNLIGAWDKESVRRDADTGGKK